MKRYEGVYIGNKPTKSPYVTSWSTKGKVSFIYCVWTCKIIYCSVRITNTCVTYEREKPGDNGQWAPHNAIWIFLSRMINYRQ